MHIVHGTWIPDAADTFVQGGSFYLWVETDAASDTAQLATPPSGDTDWKGPRTAKTEAVETVHPSGLTQTALAAFLADKLGLRTDTPGAFAQALSLQSMLLPAVNGRPLPSFELLRYVDEEVEAFEEYALAPWRVWCYRAREIIATLNSIHFIALHEAEDFQLGADLLFWRQYAQDLTGLVAKDQYIPALTYRALAPVGKAPRKNARTKAAPNVEILPGWAFLSDAYETTVGSYAAAMPAVCRAGVQDTDDARLFAAEPLLRHFSECLLYDIVVGTPFTAKFDGQIAGTLLYRCLYPYRPAPPGAPSDTLDEYKQWLTWRESLTQAHTNAGFTLCFRLEEAPSSDVDDWQLHFLVAAKHDPSLKMSLAEYWSLKPRAREAAVKPFGQEFEQNLLLALGYAARIYPAIWEGLATDQPSGRSLTLEEAFSFLKERAWVLEDAGYTVIVPSWWMPEGRRRAKIRLKTASRPAKGASAGATSRLNMDAIVSYEYQLAIGGQAVTEEEWRQLVEAKASLVQFRGEWMELDRDKMAQLLQFWQTHAHEQPEMTLLDLLKLESEDEDLDWDHDGALQEMLARLHDKSAFAPVADPPSLQGTLRDYQRRGVAWMQYLETMGLNPCLADDMGLGKTLEVIARLLKERDDDAALPPTLVIAPTSVLGNWRKEIERFAPRLRVLVHQGSARLKEAASFAETCGTYDVVLTSFALARLDEKLLRGLTWQRVVIDEAQNIKNPGAAQTKAILKLTATHRLALTGAPVENRLRDLWSIFNFLNPGYLGKEAQFRKTFETPISKDNDLAQLATLKKLVEPFILRRVKTDKSIIDDLPDKIEQIMYCTLTPEQASLYEAVVKDVTEQLDEAEGIQRKGLILSTLMRLKQICNHPAQFLQDGSAFSAERSYKLQRLGEMLEEVIESGESALIFTQFTEIGSALERWLTHTRHYNTYYLHGGVGVAKRERMVAEFQDEATEPSVFILSLRAGGVGINLTKANHVFHFDRWWNPAVEDQATDRAFRIGQRKNVFAHKFVATGTVEERISAMIEDKKKLSALVVGADEGWLTELDNDTFKDLIALRRDAVMG